MKIKFETKFEKDIRAIKDKKLLAKLKEIILECKIAETLNEINNIKKCKVIKHFIV